MIRRELLASGEIYHIFNRSIADFVVFNNESEFKRMIQLISFYKSDIKIKFSDFCNLKSVQKADFDEMLNIVSRNNEYLVQIIAYCIMPTHIHLLLKQLKQNGISEYIMKVFNSYSSNFNIRHKRKGPLWESKFKNVLVVNDEQLIHLT